MTCTTEGITVVAATAHDLGRRIVARTVHADKHLQCYVSGDLVAWARPAGGAVTFVIAEPAPTDVVLLAAVDEADAETNFWRELLAAAAAGNRICVSTPRTIAPYAPGAVWKVYLGEAGGAVADALVRQQPFHPGGRRSGGWGSDWGRGGWGFGGAASAGWGAYWGWGEWGFDCDALQWTSEPLPPGDYPLRVVVEDAQGNESEAWESTAVLHTYPRPASEPAVDSYDPQTDTLVIAFTGSEDIDP